jgi:hypothetical protein
MADNIDVLMEKLLRTSRMIGQLQQDRATLMELMQTATTPHQETLRSVVRAAHAFARNLQDLFLLRVRGALQCHMARQCTFHFKHGVCIPQCQQLVEEEQMLTRVRNVLQQEVQGALLPDRALGCAIVIPFTCL